MSESRRCNNCGGTGLAVNGSGMRIKCTGCGGGGYVALTPVAAPAAAHAASAPAGVTTNQKKVRK